MRYINRRFTYTYLVKYWGVGTQKLLKITAYAANGYPVNQARRRATRLTPSHYKALITAPDRTQPLLNESDRALCSQPATHLNSTGHAVVTNSVKSVCPVELSRCNDYSAVSNSTQLNQVTIQS